MSEEMQGIPRLEFENGRGEKGWATFGDVDDLTGADMRRLRKGVGESENFGQSTNNLMGDALTLLIDEWDVPGKPDIQAPKYDPKALNRIPATFMAALERHIQPHLDFLKPNEKKTDDGEPGSPPRPGRG